MALQCCISGISFCIGLPNFIEIKSNPAELWHYINFSRWWQWRRKSTSGFAFSIGTRSGRYTIYSHIKFR